MKFNVLTIFPELVSHYCSASILGRAQAEGRMKVATVNPRDFTKDKHRTVDDTPYGGGPGMVMMAEPIFLALQSLDAIPFRQSSGWEKVKKIFTGKMKTKKRTVLLSPRGRQFDQRLAEQWSKLDELTLVCGRYEGIDQRVVDHLVDEEVSVGPYVLAGGELGAMVIVEAVSRLLPGVLGNEESLVAESHSLDLSAEYPQYTRPVDFQGHKVPEVLLSGNHVEINKWRKEQSRP